MRSIAEINAEMFELQRSDSPIPQEKSLSLVVELIEAMPTMKCKVACLRSYLAGKMNLPLLPKDIELLNFQAQA